MEIQESLNQIKEELKKQIVNEILDILRDELDDNFSEQFIHKVEEADLNVQKGNASQYTLEEFKRDFS